MKVFISWSGDRSRRVAEYMQSWVRCVIQASRPWVSSHDIESGALWITEINSQLQDTAVGIICLTQANKDNPWILFESGALAKGLSTSRVCTILIDLEPSHIKDPLAQFNHTDPKSKESMWKLVKTINSSQAQEQWIAEAILRQIFDTYWPQFQSELSNILAATHDSAEQISPPDSNEVLAEILSSVRSLSRRVSEVESLALEDTFTRTVKNQFYSNRKHKDLEINKPGFYTEGHIDIPLSSGLLNPRNRRNDDD